VSAMIRATPVPGYAGCCSAHPKINLTGRLKEVKCPTLVIVGGTGTRHPGRVVARDPRRAPRVGAGDHPSALALVQLEQPTAFTRALALFLNKHR